MLHCLGRAAILFLLGAQNDRKGNVTSFQIQMVVFIVNGLLEAVKYGFIINVESFEQMQRKL